MFEANAEIRMTIDALYARCEELNRGDILTHEAIREVVGCEPHEGRWQHCVNQVRKRLLRSERGIEMLPERTVGYKLLTHEEQLERAPRHRKLKQYRQERMNRSGLEALPDRHLTQHQKRVKMFLVDAARKSEARIRREAKEQVQVVRATQVNPRRPAPAPPSGAGLAEEAART